MEAPPCPKRSAAPYATNRKIAAIAKSTAPFAKANTTSGLALMASTTVPIVEKPAKFPSPMPVITETFCTQIQLDADVRLAAAVGGAARFLGDAAGLSSEAAADLQSVIIAVCEEAFEHLNALHAHLDVRLTRCADRIEIALSREGDTSPAMGLDAIAGFTNPASASKGAATSVFRGIDRVQYESRGGTAVTRLTKYITPAKRIA